MTYTFRREEKDATRANRVEVSQLDPEWVQALEAEWAAHETTPDIVHVVDLPDAKAVTRHASHARAWGLSRGEGKQVNVRKLPARPGDKENTLRFSMEKYDPNAPKLGRKTKEEKAAAKSATPATTANDAKPETAKLHSGSQGSAKRA